MSNKKNKKFFLKLSLVSFIMVLSTFTNPVNAKGNMESNIHYSKPIYNKSNDSIIFQDPCQYITYTVGMEFNDGTKIYIPLNFEDYTNQNNETIMSIQNKAIPQNIDSANVITSVLQTNQVFNDFENMYTQNGTLNYKNDMEKVVVYAKLHPFAKLNDYSYIINSKEAHVFHIHFLCLNNGVSVNNEKGTVFLKQEVKTKWYQEETDN